MIYWSINVYFNKSSAVSTFKFTWAHRTRFLQNSSSNQSPPSTPRTVSHRSLLQEASPDPLLASPLQKKILAWQINCTASWTAILPKTYPLSKKRTSCSLRIVRHVEYTLARTRFDFKESHCYQAVAHSVRDRLIESFNDTYRSFHKEGCKVVYYLSL